MAKLSFKAKPKIKKVRFKTASDIYTKTKVEDGTYNVESDCGVYTITIKNGIVIKDIHRNMAWVRQKKANELFAYWRKYGAKIVRKKSEST